MPSRAVLGTAVALAVAGLAATAGPAAAQVDEREPGEGAAAARVAVYTDDDDTTVVTTLVDGEVRLPPPVAIQAHALVDAVSSASVDVVSAATERWTENRIELGGAALARLAGFDTSLAYTFSGENDWRSHSVQVGAGRDLARKNATVSLAYAYTDNAVGRARDPMFVRDLTVHGVEVSLTHVLDRRTVASIAVTGQRAAGYQASPYRYVTTMDGVTVPETHPDTRTRTAATVRLLRALGDRQALDGSYRLYGDDWGTLSHTVSVALRWELSDALDLRVRARGYYQGAARFYREVYATAAQYMSADRELATFWDAGGGFKLGWRGEHLAVDAKLDVAYYRFLDFARLAGRVTLVTGGGVQWRW